MIIKGAKVFLPEGAFQTGSVRIRGEKIEAIALGTEGFPETGEEVLDAEGAYLVPGFIDLHFHGAMGEDVCDGTESAVQKIAAYELGIGVTSICPATMTLPVEELKGVLSCLAGYRRKQQAVYEDLAGNEAGAEAAGGDLRSAARIRETGAELVGVNMEGPFISPAKKGAQDARHILPRNARIFAELQQSAEGLIRFMGIAPEEKGEDSVEDFIAEVKKSADVSLAHTNAGYSHAKAAFAAGANHAVHLYNAMVGMSHREPGCVGAAADSPHVLAELICDGVHVHEAVIRNTFRLFGGDRLILISDSMRATGMPDGQYTLGGLDVIVHGKTARLVSDGAIAGSVTNLPDCVRTAISFGIPLEEAIASATEVPARSLHVEDHLGRIAPGYQADLVLWNERYETKAVIKRGVRI